MTDHLGAYIQHDSVSIPPLGDGPLSGLTFAVKDLFDIAGHVTGAGSPDWLASHSAATVTASSVTKLLKAGAAMVAKAQTDEMAFSITGQNAHYGTPKNINAPGRIPGGSSSGSAAAVAGDWSILPWGRIQADRCACRPVFVAYTAFAPPRTGCLWMAFILWLPVSIPLGGLAEVANYFRVSVRCYCLMPVWRRR